jgi:predicted nucleic acid-binding protein
MGRTPGPTFVDADILIWHLRGHDEAFRRIEQLAEAGDSTLAIGALQRVEVAIYVRPAEEQAAAALLALFVTVPLTEEVVDLGARYFRRWNPSHGMGAADALLAATASLTGGRIITQNVRHFMVPGLVVEQGW